MPGPLKIPDPFIPGRVGVVGDPEFVVATCCRTSCPVCNKLLRLMERDDPTRTLPPPIETAADFDLVG